jgi:hypothetical protein
METIAEATEVTLLSWIRDDSNKPADTMIYKDGLNAQVNKIHSITGMLWSGERGCSDYLYKDREERAYVINTHRSKSIVLPVYKIIWKGMTFILRDNFYNWKVSVESETPIIRDFEDIFEDETIPSVYCEGFTDDQVYGKYSENNKKFTIELGSDNGLYFFFRKIWYHIRRAEKNEVQLQGAVQAVINMLPDELRNAKETMGGSFLENLEKLRDEGIASNSAFQNWSYLGTIMSLTLNNDKVDPDLRDKLYMAALGHKFYKTVY